MKLLGGSVRGPAHSAEGRPNEDAWYARVSRAGGCAVVCDGVGSRSAARLGAQAGARSARRAWAIWKKSPAALPEDFVRLVEVLWRLELGRTPLEDACTTLLFAGIRPEGTGLLAQIGDGLVGIHSDGEFRAVTEDRATFGSMSCALGMPHKLKDWNLVSLESFGSGARVLLATDGIADDLVAEKREAFVTWLLHEFGERPNASRRLRRALARWPVPHHRDDKTLVILWNPSEK